MSYNEDYDSPENTYYYSEERRNDPILRGKVEKVTSAQNSALAEAAELLKQAAQILNEQGQFVDSDIYNRNVMQIQQAKNRVMKDIEFMSRPLTDTYIGNKAAGPLGEQLQKMGDKFPL